MLVSWATREQVTYVCKEILSFRDSKCLFLSHFNVPGTGLCAHQWRVLHWVAGPVFLWLPCLRSGGPGLFCACFLSGLDELEELVGETKTILRDDRLVSFSWQHSPLFIIERSGAS